MHITAVTKTHLHEAFCCQPVAFKDIAEDEVLSNHGGPTFLIWPAENSPTTVDIQVVALGVKMIRKPINQIVYDPNPLFQPIGINGSMLFPLFH